MGVQTGYLLYVNMFDTYSYVYALVTLSNCCTTEQGLCKKHAPPTWYVLSNLKFSLTYSPQCTSPFLPSNISECLVSHLPICTHSLTLLIAQQCSYALIPMLFLRPLLLHMILARNPIQTEVVVVEAVAQEQGARSPLAGEGVNKQVPK